MTGIVKVQVGMVLSLDQPGNGSFLVQKFMSPTSVEIVSLVTSETIVVDVIRLKPNIQFTRTRPDLASVRPKVIDAAQIKFNYIKDLIDGDRNSLAEVQKVAASANVSVSTVYRWLKEFQEGRVLSTLFRKERSDSGKGRLNPAVEKIVTDAIANFWMTPEKRNVSKLSREIARLCKDEGLKAPSLPTIISRAQRIEGKVAVKRRNGQAAARKGDLIKGTVPNADRPYGVIPIAH